MNKNQDIQSTEYPSDREILAAMVSELTAECIRLGVSITYAGSRYGDGIVIGASGASNRVICLSEDEASKKVSNWIKKLNAFDSRSELLRAL